MVHRSFQAAQRVSLWVLIIATLVVRSHMASQAAQMPSAEGLVLWLDAGDTNGDGQSSGEPATGTRLQLWQDRSESGNHVRQDAMERQPIVVADAIGGRPAVRFTQSSLERKTLAGFLTGDQRFQIFVVMRAQPQDSVNPRLLDIPTQPVYFEISGQYFWKRRGFWLGYRDLAEAAGKPRLGIHVGDEGQSRQIAWDGNDQLLEAVYAGNQRWGLYQNGVPVGRGKFRDDNTFIGFEGGARLAIGRDFGSKDITTCFQGDMAEVLIYNRVLKVDEQRRVGQYLATKYGVRTTYSDATPIAAPNFESDILPILAGNCGDCHGATELEAELNLESLSGLLRGGASGPAIQRGQAAESLLFYMIATGSMPPGDENRLADDDIERIRHWIDAGAQSDLQVDAPAVTDVVETEHWSFQKLRPTGIPRVSSVARVRTDVDAFVLAKLEAAGLGFSPDPERVTLIRRAYLDLIGLLPTPEETNQILAQDRDAAWEQLLDRLLESPHFGERWGRHWLDEAGYSDTIPTDNDQQIVQPGLGKWKYRDYVVRAFNQDKPFAEFLTEQLAGDELVDWRNAARLTPDMREKLVATGFLRCSPDVTHANESNTLVTRYAILHRTCETLAGNLLGLTLQCCRCHDHKFEPLPQRDYYRFAAFIAPALNPHHWLQPLERQLPGLGSAEKAEIDHQIKQFSTRQQQLRQRAGTRLLARNVAQLPAGIQTEVKVALQKPAQERDKLLRELVDKIAELDQKWNQQLLDSLTDREKQADEECSAAILRLNNRLRDATVQAIYDTGPPSKVYVLYRGEYEMPRASVEPRVFGVLAPRTEQPSSENSAVGSTSGRRLALAQQLTNWESPTGALAVRVRVNRVWQRLFGKGLVQTPDNLGVSGESATHPELLEWLSQFFVQHEGRLKPLVKLLMSSTVYRQSARTSVNGDADAVAPQTAESRRIDPANTLLWRQRLRRLESEIVRDAILSASGRLDETIGGPPTGIENLPDGMVIEAGSSETPSADRRWRRSMYLLQRRNYHLSMLAAFDQPSLVVNCTRRDTSSVVSQSLTMLNDRFVLRQASFLAERVERDSPDSSLERQIAMAFRLVLARELHEDEGQWCAELHARHVQTYQANGMGLENARHQALVQICHMLLNTSEFLYIQ